MVIVKRPKKAATAKTPMESPSMLAALPSFNRKQRMAATSVTIQYSVV
jgi:hypothetical protein